MRKIFISAGHSTDPAEDMGAYGNGCKEGVLAAELRTLISTRLQNVHGVTAIVDGDDTVLSETLRKFKNLTSSDAIVIDIHFNASANEAATGTEVLVPAMPSSFEQFLAKEFSDVTAEALGVKNRGVKTELDSHHGRLGWMRLKGENILLEVCFISNARDMKHYHDYKHELAKRYAEVIYKAANA